MENLADKNRFASALAQNSCGELEPWDVKVASSASFIAIPTKGSIVPGWLLVVPRRATLSIRNLTVDEKEEYNEFCAMLIARITAEFCPPTVFEHGASETGSLIGCGVDHAHSHIVPLGFDLIDAVISDKSSGICWKEYASEELFFSLLKPKSDYLFIKSPDGRFVGAYGFSPTSQYLRRVIARNVGAEFRWDYQSDLFVENIHLTLSRLSKSYDAMQA